MPFNREWREANGEDEGYYVNRTRTGPPVPAATGTTVEAGAVVADSPTVTIRPAKTIKVSIPGPREPVLSADGIMAPRWRRFFEELYRRTGALEDNVNGLTDVASVGQNTTDALVLSGKVPTLARSWAVLPPAGSLTATGELADRTVA